MYGHVREAAVSILYDYDVITLLDTIKAVAYIRQMTGGMYTQSHLIKGQDGNEYILKIPPQNDNRSNLNEYLGCRLGDHCDLPVLKPFLIKLTLDFIELVKSKLGDVDEGEYFGTIKQDKINLDEDRIKQLDPKKFINQQDVPKFIMFDILIDNIDRNPGNYFLIYSDDCKKFKYVLIDHGHIFGGPEHDFNINDTLPYRCPQQPWNLKCLTEKDFECAARYIAKRINPGVMDAFLKESPSNWRECYGAKNILSIISAMGDRKEDKILSTALSVSQIRSSIYRIAGAS